jgi:hypothetical protein
MINVRQLAYKMGLRLSRFKFVSRAIADRADLSAFDHKPTVPIVVGVSMIGLSFLWAPVVSFLGVVAIHLHRPWIFVIGGPLTYGLSHLVYLGGMALSGAKYSRLFLRWLTRVTVEKLLSFGAITPKDSVSLAEKSITETIKNQRLPDC